MEVLTEDQALASAGATPNASVGTGAHTIWLMATVVLKAASSGPATAPAAPTGVSATAGNASATVSWNAPSNGGSLITSYTVTPYAGSTALTPTTVTGTPPTTNATISGLTNGTSLHVHGHRDQRDRHRTPILTIQRRHAADRHRRPVVGADDLADGRNSFDPAKHRERAAVRRLAAARADAGLASGHRDVHHPDRAGQHLLLGDGRASRRKGPRDRRLRRPVDRQDRDRRHQHL